MWLWRRKSLFKGVGRLKKCFISHSYKDAEACERLVAHLPRNVKPFIFPPIVVPPEQMVSDKLLDAIRDYDRLIYVQGGASAASFWVALERDYALRIGKPVFGYNPTTGVLSRDRSRAMNLSTTLTYADEDQEVGQKLAAELQRHYFSVFNNRPWVPGSDITKTVEDAMRRVVQAGSYVILLFTPRSMMSVWMNRFAELAVRVAPERVLCALSADSDWEPWDLNSPEYEQWVRLVHAVRHTQEWVQISGDKERSRAQRIDDLIVRLYWLIYRNTRQNQLT